MIQRTQCARRRENFLRDADKTVPVAVSRARIAAMRKAGGHPLSTEYAGVDHNVWEWASRNLGSRGGCSGSAAETLTRA